MMKVTKNLNEYFLLTKSMSNVYFWPIRYWLGVKEYHKIFRNISSVKNDESFTVAKILHRRNLYFLLRMSNHRDACVLMKLPEDWEPLNCSKKSFLSNGLKCFGNVILTVPGKVYKRYFSMNFAYNFKSYSVTILYKNIFSLSTTKHFWKSFVHETGLIGFQHLKGGRKGSHD